MKIVIVGCTHAGTAAVVNLKELHPESEITIYEKNDNLSFLSCGIALNVGGVIKETKNLFYNSPENLAKMGVIYFANNIKIDVDENEHGFYGDVCWCGKPKVGEATRPVGFITLVKNWIPSRQEEYKTRKWITDKTV